MWRFALKQVLHEPLRSCLTASAIAATIAVILVLRGFEQGLYLQSEKVVLDRGGELFLTQSGVSNFLAVRSSIPQLSRAEVEQVTGVKEAHPVTGFWVIYGPQGNKFPVLLLVYDTLGGPTNIVQGREIETGREIVIDLSLAKRFGLKPGDPMLISDFEFTIVGISTGNSALFSSFAFIGYDGLIDLLIESELAADISTFPLVSFLLVELRSGFVASDVAMDIEAQVKSVDVHLPRQLADSDMRLGRELFGPIMGVLVALAYVIGILVVGLLLYGNISARQQDLVVLKALGFKVIHIGTAVIFQVLVLIVVAFPLGMAVAWLISLLVQWVSPEYLVHVMDPLGLWHTLTGVVLMAVAGSLTPLRMISRCDPVLAFKPD